MRSFSVATDYEYKGKRDRLTIWSGPFASTLEGEAYSLPKRDGYMVTSISGKKARAICPVGRTGDNYQEIDAAISVARSSLDTA